MLKTLVASGLLAPLRPDKYLAMAREIRRSGINATTGITLSAVRCPQRRALVDEQGSLTFRELDASCNSLAKALQDRGVAAGDRVGILCRNHRGFVQSLAAVGRIGADAVLLNTAFAGPQLAEVLGRESVDLLILDAEFRHLLEGGHTERPIDRVIAWDDGRGDLPTLEQLIEGAPDARPSRPERAGSIVLLTSGTTGTPKGASRPGGGDTATLTSMLEMIPWRAEETVVVAAPMFHAWGFGQLLIASTMACTVVMSRRFDPEATLAAAQLEGAAGIAVVPVMLERIVDLPAAVKAKYSLPKLRFVTSSGSRMRADAVVSFMDDFGETIYNSYNATEAGMISVAKPADLRISPLTAGRPLRGVDIALLDEAGARVAAGEVGQIFVRSGTTFDGYTDGGTKPMREGYLSSGDLGRVDARTT